MTVLIYTGPDVFFSKNRFGNICKFIPKRLGDYLLQRINFKTIQGNDKRIYYYKSGYYKENGIAFIRFHSTKLLGSLFKNTYVEETIAYIRNKTYISPNSINHKWINLQNGLLNPLTRKFIAHSPKVFCLRQIPIEYNPEAKCPIWEEKLKEKVSEDWQFDAVQDMFGYCFINDNRFERAYLFHGPPRTMKSTILYVLTQLLGEQNIQSMSLQYLTEDKHGPAFLYGCPANICADLSAAELRHDAMFLKITGQDYITAGKKFENEITFLPYTKLIFSCNAAPATRNKGDAFYRRWFPLEFKKQHEVIDPTLRSKFIAELPGILNWALDGTKRLLEKNELKCPYSIAQIKDIYERSSDSISSFILNYIDCENDEGALKKREVYKKYEEYCLNNDLRLENQVLFGRRFKEMTGCGDKKIGSIPGYAGVDWKGPSSPGPAPNSIVEPPKDAENGWRTLPEQEIIIKKEKVE